MQCGLVSTVCGHERVRNAVGQWPRAADAAGRSGRPRRFPLTTSTSVPVPVPGEWAGKFTGRETRRSQEESSSCGVLSTVE